MEIKKVGVLGCGLMGSGITLADQLEWTTPALCHPERRFLPRRIYAVLLRTYT